MKKVFLAAGTFIFAVLIVSLTLNARTDTAAGDKAPEKRPDLVVIDGMASFGPLERQPVAFPHDAHTSALEKAGKDCSACHEKNPEAADGELVYYFKRLENSDADTVRDIYHSACIACHEETLSKGEKSGPVSCNACHTESPAFVADQLPMEFDHSLHYRHTKAMENKCEKCHHEYDQAANKLIYVKGKEGTCRYCHGEKTVENRISMQEAAHLDCITCHREKAARNLKAGPSKCAGCHDAQERARITTVESPPRYDRNQPDATLVLPVQVEGKGRTEPVVFDHKVHESATATCRACHHADMTACADCHTADGIEKGGGVSLMQAMHKTGATESCFGCHHTQKEQDTCAGCHASMPQAGLKEENCTACHTALPDPDTDMTQLTDEARRTLATEMLAATPAQTPAIPPEEVAETVTIGSMADQYKAAKLPHRKMYATLAQGIAESKLAGFFHTGETTLCQGCHHNSPAGLKPPSCASCHSQPSTETDLLMPGLRGAYHQQCIGCHKAMKIEKTGCTDCHEKK